MQPCLPLPTLTIGAVMTYRVQYVCTTIYIVQLNVQIIVHCAIVEFIRHVVRPIAGLLHSLDLFIAFIASSI